MPAQQSHLRWIEIRDFAPGLWEKADWLMPPTAAQTLTDAYPQQGGGLRAFFKPTALSTTGIVDPTKERVIGLTARLVENESDRFLMTAWYDPAAGSGLKSKARLYRMNEAASETTWTQVFKTSGTTEFASSDTETVLKGSFRTFTLADGTRRVVFVLRTTNDSGLYRLNVADSSATIKAIKIDTSASGNASPDDALTIHQARIMVAHDGRLMWSDPGTETFAAPNFLLVNPNVAAPIIRIMEGAEPSDLLILQQGPGPSIVQGDITDPVVQIMSTGLRFGATGDAGHSPLGLLVNSTDGYLYLTDGRTFENLSSQLEAHERPANIISNGDAVFMDEFIFKAGGYVYDTRTKSWFKQSGLQGMFLDTTLVPGAVWGTVAATGNSFSLAQVTPKNNSSRVSTYTWKSAPLRSDDGRRLMVREVEIYAKPYDSSATIAVTVGGVTRTKTLDGSSTRQSLRFLFPQTEAEVLDVQVVSTAGSASNEAPSIESLRIGLGIGHLA